MFDFMLSTIRDSLIQFLLPRALTQLLDHPNIMHLYDVWSSETELYLVLEYIEGGELFDYLCSKEQHLHLLEAVSILKQVCSMTTAGRPTTHYAFRSCLEWTIVTGSTFATATSNQKTSFWRIRSSVSLVHSPPSAKS
jgi:hypothetical protein